MLTDTHCHLNLRQFDEDRAAVIARAVDAGVRRMLNPSIDLDTSRSALELAQAHEAVYAAVGVHPNDCAGLPVTWLDELEALARRPKAVAIGEIGLDYYWDQTPHDVQQHVFQQQLDLARRLALPVVIHCRDKTPPRGPALEDLLSLLTAWQIQLKSEGHPLAERPGVLHSFSGDLPAAERATAHNFLIGVTGPLTFKKADVLREVVAALPETALLIETDAPFLAPHPHRGERNEPAYVRHVVEKMAEVRRVDVETMMRQTAANAERLFHWQGTTSRL